MTTTTVYKQLTPFIFGVCFMLMLVSCGGDAKSGAGEPGKPSRDTNPIEDEVPEELGLVGRYEVKFDSLNSHIGGNLYAQADLQVLNDQIVVRMDVRDSVPSTPHSQFIYSGTECPSLLTNDTNGDGNIDPIEASAVIGDILVPLDSNIDGQDLGQNEFQAADIVGKYTYEIEGVLSRLLADLHAPDMNMKDEISKLKSTEKLKLEGKVIVIQGIAQTVYLPASVRTHGGTSDRGSFIKSCGKIKRRPTPVVSAE